jgi:hypothetical protein
VNFELGVPITAVFKAKRLKFMIASGKGLQRNVQVSPLVRAGVFRTIDANEATEAEVDVIAENVRAHLVDPEWNADVKGNVAVGSWPAVWASAHILVAQKSSRCKRPAAVASSLAVDSAARELLERGGEANGVGAGDIGSTLDTCVLYATKDNILRVLGVHRGAAEPAASAGLAAVDTMVPVVTVCVLYSVVSVTLQLTFI